MKCPENKIEPFLMSNPKSLITLENEPSDQCELNQRKLQLFVSLGNLKLITHKYAEINKNIL